MYCNNDSFWKYAQWIDCIECKNARWLDVEYFIKRYTNTLQFNIYETKCLYAQFVKYLSNDELPTDISKVTILSEYDDGSVEYRMDTIWYHISKMKSVVVNNDRFSLLFKCTLVVLLTPHSNATITDINL